MATSKTKQESNAQPSAAEMRQWYQENKDTIDSLNLARENFSKADEALTQLRNYKKVSTKSVTAYTRETIRTYLSSIGSNESNLRKVSQYLYWTCQPYQRLIEYWSNMIDLKAYTVIPPYSFAKNNNVNKITKSYNNTIDVFEKMNVSYEMYKAYKTCWLYGVFYGVVYYDDTGMFILPMDADYCRIAGIYQTGDFSFAMNMSYFRNRQELLELWGEPFASMYKQYQQSPSDNLWQIVPDEYAICFKTDPQEWELIVPPFSGMFEPILNLLDLTANQAIADKQSIYKLLWIGLETISGSKIANDWKISPEIVAHYYNRMLNELLPDYISAAVIPGQLNSISFDKDIDKTNDTNKVSNATKTLFNTSGGSQILNSNSISGATAYKAVLQSDTEYAISALLPQTQAWVNRFISYHVSNPSTVKFFEISAYTKDEFRSTLIQQAQNGLPVKTAILALDGLSPRDGMALNMLEEEILGVSEKFKPLSSSYTQASSAGAPQKNVDELSDEGVRSRDSAGQNG